MFRVGIYIHAPASEFLEWLETWTSRGQAVGYAGGQGRIKFGAAQRHILLSQHLAVEVPGTLQNDLTNPEPTSFSVTFRVLPVGLGHSVVADGVSDTQELFPFLVEFAGAVGERWPQAAVTAWFGEPPCRPVELCVLRVRSTFPTLERALSDFAENFATTAVRSVSFSPMTGSSDATAEGQPRRHAQWIFRLSLHTNAGLQGIDHVNLTCDVSRIGTKRPLTLTLSHHGFLYKEIDPFTAAFIVYCQSQWHDTQVSGLVNHPLELRIGLADLERLTVADRPWELITDNAWDRLLIELWWMDYPSTHIARRVGVASRTVINRLSELRKIYGKSIVPVESQRRGKRDEKS